MYYDKMNTRTLLSMLVSRDARKHEWEGDSYHPFSDSADEHVLANVIDELAERIDGPAAELRKAEAALAEFVAATRETKP